MTVSFVIPSYNNAALLSKALAGFAIQEPCDLAWEIIVIDNNSADTSIAVTQLKFRDQLPITLIQQPKLPHTFALCRARNLGLRLSKSEWIVCMDADIIPNPSYLKTLSKHLNQIGKRPTIASCERIFISTGNIRAEDILENTGLLEQLPHTSSPSNYGLPNDRRLPAMRRLPDVEHPWDYMHGCNALYRREDALKIGGYNEVYDGRWGFEDIDFAYRMITEANCVPVYLRQLHVYHQDLPEDISSTDRLVKSSNPNWHRVCELIPGYEEYKATKYRQFSKSIRV